MAATLLAQQNNGCGIGCGGLLALATLGFVLAYWHFFLIAAVFVAAIAAVVYAALLHKQRFRHDPCMVQQRFGAIDSLNVAGDLYTPRINVVCRTLDSDSNYRHSSVISTSISPPVELSRLRAASGVNTWLQSAAMACLKERHWTADALTKLAGLTSALARCCAS